MALGFSGSVRPAMDILWKVLTKLLIWPEMSLFSWIRKFDRI